MFCFWKVLFRGDFGHEGFCPRESVISTSVWFPSSLFISVPEPSSTANILSRYLNTSTVRVGPSPSFMLSSWYGVGIYYVLVLLKSLSFRLISPLFQLLLFCFSGCLTRSSANCFAMYFHVRSPRHQCFLWQRGGWALNPGGGLRLLWSNQCTHLVLVFCSSCPWPYLWWPWSILLDHYFFSGATKLTSSALYRWFVPNPIYLLIKLKGTFFFRHGRRIAPTFCTHVRIQTTLALS